MKVIFLDIDGVLNCNMTSTYAPSGVLGVEGGKALILKDIVRQTDARLILVSTWRRGWSSDREECTPDGRYLVDKLNRYRLRISGKTHDSYPRGQGIARWLKQRSHVTDWIVIDDEVADDYEEFGILPHLVKTDFEGGGLTKYHVDECVRRLKGGRGEQWFSYRMDTP